MIRVCPHSDSTCPHGMACTFSCATAAYDGTKRAPQTSSSNNGEGDVEGLVERLTVELQSAAPYLGDPGLRRLHAVASEAASAISKLIGERDASELARELLAQELREERWHHDQTAGGLNDAIAVLHQKLQAAEQGGCRVVFSPAAKRRAWQLVEDAAKRLDGYEVEDVEILRALEAAEDEPDWKARAQAAEQEIGELREGLKPFAAVAGPMKGEDGRPTYLDLIIESGGTEELAVTTIFDTGGRGAVLWADDFRKARALLSRGGSGEGNQGVSSSQDAVRRSQELRSDGPHSAGGEP